MPLKNKMFGFLFTTVATIALVGCSAGSDLGETTGTQAASSSTEVAKENTPTRTADYSETRNAYFGDLHVHTKYSFDAFIFNVRATPDDAYTFARGEPVKHPAGFTMLLNDKPLDFLVVTDHSEYLGVLPAMADPDHALSKVSYASDLFSTDPDTIVAAFQKIAFSLRDGKRRDELKDDALDLQAWQEEIAAAERHNDPGTFTTFIGYEFTSAPGGRNLHRNVIFADNTVPELPFTAFDSQNPELLWKWMDDQRADGIEALAIPHNSNGSDGTMFETVNWAGDPLDADYAALRMRNEPLVEITQVKGTSETHPLLSPNDEWAGFEISDSYIGSTDKITKFEGGYVRDALNTGLEFQASQGFNPYEFGLIGASDTHNAAGSYHEDNYWSKIGIPDSTPVRRGSVPPDGKTWDTYTVPEGNQRYSHWGASGLTGVWSEENTREAIYAALRRKETFATSGPRIKVRLFAGRDLDDSLLSSPTLLAEAYADGVPMGSTIETDFAESPGFLIWAFRDPNAGWLDRAQIIKGWVEDGVAQEKVFDVACSGGEVPDVTTHRCNDNGATVDTTTCETRNSETASELKTVWKDPEYNPDQLAYYYVRVLQNPSCRWSTWDAERAHTEPNPDLPRIIQERAWSSPIWYKPEA